MSRVTAQTMSAGDLTAFVEFQVPEGQVATGYTTRIERVPANIRTAIGNELLKFGAQVAVNPVIVMIRYRNDVRTDWRIWYPAESRAFQITGYGDETGEREWLTIYATELLQ
jgi:SPP1 family predicted phage head-tail adaptor